MKAIAVGILASFFFAFTSVLNRAMDLEGGSWIWSASHGTTLWFQCFYLLSCIEGI